LHNRARCQQTHGAVLSAHSHQHPFPTALHRSAVPSTPKNKKGKAVKGARLMPPWNAGGTAPYTPHCLGGRSSVGSATTSPPRAQGHAFPHSANHCWRYPASTTAFLHLLAAFYVPIFTSIIDYLKAADRAMRHGVAKPPTAHQGPPNTAGGIATPPMSVRCCKLYQGLGCEPLNPNFRAKP
jgi:hypothetical protein